MTPSSSRTEADIRRIVFQIILLVLGAAGVVWLLFALRKIILLLVFTTLFCYLVAPLVKLLSLPRRVFGLSVRTPRSLAIFAVYFFVFYSLFMAFDRALPVLSDQLGALSASAPAYVKQLDGYSRTLKGLPAKYRLPAAWQQAFVEGWDYAAAGAVDWLQSIALRTVGMTAYAHWLVLIPVLGFFFLLDARSYRQQLLASLPQADVRVRVADFLRDVSETLAGYIRAQLIACLLIGVITGVGLRLVGVSYSLVFAVAAGLLEFIPVIGPAVLGVIAVLVASFHGWREAALAATFLIVLRLMHDYFIYPRLISRRVEIHPVLVLLAVLCGAELGGITGVFLGVPVMALLLVCWRHWGDLMPVRRVPVAEAAQALEKEYAELSH